MLANKMYMQEPMSSIRENQPSRKRAIMTICSHNYFPYARVLLSSLKQHHPEASLFLCLADIIHSHIQLEIEGVNIIEARQLGIPQFSDFAFRYSIMEFNTAIKPFMMRYLIEKYDFDQVVYLDPDIEVFAPMNQVFDALNNGWNFVLTPHLTSPAEKAEYYPDDIGIMKAGIYNLGFIAVNNHSDVIRFLHWWGRRLRFQCLNQQDQGFFVDQKFVDLLPGFCDNVKILRDPTLNVAYWNLWQRFLEEKEDGWLVNGQPLVFFHFSGIDKEDPHQLSKNTVRFRGNLQPALQSILTHYISKLKSYEIKPISFADYSYDRFDNGILITDLIRTCYRTLKEPWEKEPFAEFYNYLNQPAQEAVTSSPYLITNLMYYVWKQQENLQGAFNLSINEDRKKYILWFIQISESFRIDPYFLIPIFEQIEDIQRHLNQDIIQASSFSKNSRRTDVTVIGYLRATTGVAHAGRMLFCSLDKAPIHTNGYNVTLNVESLQKNSSVDHCLSQVVDGKIHIYSINANQLSLVKQSLSESKKSAEYVINMPFWELSKFPSEWLSSYEDIDEIWAPSRFIQQALLPMTDLPVIWMPPAVYLNDFTKISRTHFKLPEDKFLFHFNFDLSSFTKRENPMAVLAAYRRAFPNPSSGISTGLVIKTRGQDTDDNNLKYLIESTKEDPDIFVVNQLMTYQETLGLMDCCNCYVSLHRSEGFGYTIAEAMLLGKPVIATDYSGSKDLIDASSGFPVHYQLCPLEAGEYLYWENQEWADPDIDHAAWLMQKILLNSDKTKKITEAGKRKVLKNHSLGTVSNRYNERIKQIGL